MESVSTIRPSVITTSNIICRGDKGNHRILAQNFIDATGLPVAVPNYRLSPADITLVSADSVRHPTHASDIVRALMAIKTSSELTAIADTDNLYLVGHSCGCHMISTIMLDSPHGQSIPLNPSLPSDLLLSIKGVAFVGGFYDIDAVVRSYPEYREWIAAALPQTPEGSFAEYSVDRYTVRESGPPIPWLIIHSAGDKAVDEQQSSEMVENLRREYERLGHDKVLIRGDIGVTDLGDHIALLNNAGFAKLASTIV
jgi:acetyl esterase/lipase